MRRGAMRWAAALALGAVLAQPAQANPGTAGDGPAIEGVSRWWEVAAGWLSAGWQVAVAELTLDRGAYIDPNGVTADSDHGPMIDPDGVMADSDRGSSTDPNGVTADSDHGSQTDPNG